MNTKVVGWKKLSSFQEAEQAAQAETLRTGTTYLAYDYGENVWPRYGIIAPPKVGDLVSYAFNGDYYPDGAVVKVSSNYRIITTSTGNKYYRRKLSPSWKQTGGTWTLVPGHIDERNPSF